MSNETLQRVSTPTEDVRVASFHGVVHGLLVPGEKVEAWAVQRRLFALLNRRKFVIATTGRLLIFMRNLIAGYDMHDIRWQDLTSVQVRVGVFGATLTVGHSGGADLASSNRPSLATSITGLRRAQAQEVYRLCQAHDQAWREKRRIRDLEEMRARSGGIQIGGSNQPGMLPSTSNESATARLQQAKEMVAKGLITDAEYEALKAKIIAGL
ncbi:MAG: SHOCT domain-containing protein [Polyangiaceae bacterium]